MTSASSGVRYWIGTAAMVVSAVVFAPQAAAQSCREEAGRTSIGGGSNLLSTTQNDGHSSDPRDAEQCMVLARIYCDLADDRDAKVPKDLAIAHVSNWLADYRRVGSHVRPNYRKTLEPAANFVFDHPELDTWAVYYHAGYRCVAARDRTVDFERFSAVQDSCEQMHPNDYEGDRDSAIAKCYTKNLQMPTGRVIVGNTVVGPKN